MPPRILWLSHFAPYPATGHGALQRTHHLLVQTARRYETHVVALVPNGLPAANVSISEAERALQRIAASARLFALPPDPLRVRTAGRLVQSAIARPSYWERLFASPDAAAYIRLFLQRTPVDVVHLDTVYLCGYVPVLGGTPFVLNHHNIESHLLGRRADRKGRLARRFFQGQARATLAIEQEFAARARSNLVVSDLDGQRLHEIAPSARVTTIPNGVDVDFFAPDHSTTVRPASLVWAGGMDWFPNADAIEWFATSLWPALAADNPQRSAAIIGRNAPARVVELAAADSRVQVLGFVDDVRPHVWQAATYICPIRVGGGTRLKVLDALALGRPLVATKIGVEGIGLTNGEHYLEANNVAETVAQLRRLEQDSRLALRLADAGRAFVMAHYSWDGIGERLGRVYDRVLGRSPDRLHS